MAEIDVKLRDGLGGKNVTEVTQYNAIKSHELVPPLPRSGTPARRVPFIRKIDLNNAGTGHDGSVTPVELTLVESDPTDTYNIYVQNLVVVIADSAVPFGRFGNISGTTNTIDMFISQQGVDNFLFEGVSSNGELLIYAGGGDLMPTNPATINSYSGTTDAIVATFDMNELIPTVGVGGIEIGRGTFDEIKLRINDNLSGGSALDDFFCLVKGYALYE